MVRGNYPKGANMAGMKGYETIYITPPELPESVAAEIKENLQKLTKKFKGKDVVFTDWGKRRLGYTIAKNSRGNYWYYCYTGEAKLPNEIDRSLRLNEKVLRHLTIKITDSDDAPLLTKIQKDGGVFTSAAEESS